jgi:hypothetical protein
MTHRHRAAGAYASSLKRGAGTGRDLAWIGGQPSRRPCRYCSGMRQIGQGVTKVKVGPVPPRGQRGNAMGPPGAGARHWARALAPAGRGRFTAAAAVALVPVLAR